MKIAVIGTFQVGKSTLVNCLINDAIAGVGNGVATTHVLNYFKGGRSPNILCRDISGKCIYESDLSDDIYKSDLSDENCNISIPDGTVRIMYELASENNILKDNILIDTPGLDAAGKDASWDSIHTSDIIRDNSVDLLLLVVPNSQLDDSIKKRVLPLIKESKKQVIVLMNCYKNNPDPNSRQNLETAMAIDDELREAGIRHSSICEESESKVLSCNVAWWWIAQCQYKKWHWGNLHTREAFQECSLQAQNYFKLLFGNSAVSNETFKQKSNVSKLFSFLNDDELRERLWELYHTHLYRSQIKDALMKKMKEKHI